MASETLSTHTPRRRFLLVAVAFPVAAVAAVVAAIDYGGGTPIPVPGLPEAGAVTAWGLPVARTLMNLAGAATVGLLLYVAALSPGEQVQLTAGERRHSRLACFTGTVWAIAAAASLVFTLSDLTAQPAGRVLSASRLLEFATSTPPGGALALVAAAAVLTSLCCAGATSVYTARWALVLGVAGLLPPAFNGHSAAASNHMTAVLSLVVHVVGAALWVGGLLAVLLAGWRRDPGAPTAARAFSRVAGWALLAVAVSGGIGAAVRLPSPADAFTTRYGQLMLAKTAALVVLGACGAWHRRRTLAVLEDGERRGFLRLAVVEVLVMAVTFGLAVGLSRAPAPPDAAGTATQAERLLGFPMPAPLGGFPWTPLFTEWRFDAFFGFTTFAAAAAYLAGVRALHKRGDKWPVGRTISWMFGLAVIVVATMSGLGTYGTVLFSVHMGQHMVLAMAVPVLLVLGGPMTLALRALPAARKGERPGAREILITVLNSRYVKVIAHPAVASVLFIASAFAVYYSSLFAVLMRNHYGHVAMLVHFLTVGLLFFWGIIGIDPAPRRLPHLAKLMILMLTMPFHSWFSISLMSSTDIIGADWWRAVDRRWGVSLAADQYDAGAIAWATGDIPVLFTAIALAIQWVRSDARDARRIDRAIDRGDGNDPLAAYNAYLAALRARDRRPPAQSPQAESKDVTPAPSASTTPQPAAGDAGGTGERPLT